ncbi:hypothetical protein [Burkholderia sp. S171]|uniref:hypothetical protein n=1 Tax=Burkholderia sp. S171 TaxID=1641860 RepID=UPI00131BC5A5|nr:hypothetical protein [Burkholderia sp. S171]
MTNMKTLTCGTRARQNAKIIQSVAPQIIPTPEPAEGFGYIIPMKTLGELHTSDWTAPAGMSPDAVSQLKAISLAEKMVKLKDPLFSGTLVFVRLIFTIGGQANSLSVSEADTYTAIDFARRAVIPITQYASQYGPNSVVVKPDPLTAPVTIQNAQYNDDTLRDWIKTIVTQNQLDTKTTCLVFLNPEGVVNTSGAIAQGTGGYHDMGEVPYVFANVAGQNFTLGDPGWQFAGHLSHEIAEMVVDSKPNGNPEVCDQCGPNCASTWLNYFTEDSVYIATTQAFPPPFTYGFFINGIVSPTYVGPCPPALSISDQKLACSYAPPAHPLGMSTAMAPASAGRTGNLFVFTVAANGRILFNQIAPGGAWVGVQEIPGGFITDAPVAAGMQGTTLFVFAKDTQGQLHFTQALQGGAFAAWEAVPGAIKTSLAPACAGRTGNLFVFAVEASGQIVFNQIAPGGNFVGWQAMPGAMATAAAVAAGMQGNTLFVFAKDQIGQLHFTQAPQGGAFAAWQAVPGGLVTPAAPASAGRAGNLFVFAEKNDGSIAFNQIAPGGPFIGWQTIPGVLITDAPTGAGMQGTTLFVFAKDKQGVVHFVEAQTGGAFTGWQV